jgi:membrane protein
MVGRAIPPPRALAPLMPRQHPGAGDALLIIAATALTVFAARTYWQSRRSALGQSSQIDAAGRDPDQLAAAVLEPGRGRLATNPWQIPWRGWRDILWRTYQQINEDRLLATAAGIVFYGLLALFPAITALVSLYGLFADPKTITSNLQSLALMLPEGSFQIVQDQIARVVAKGNSALSATFVFGLALSLWSANAGVKAMIDALNVVYDEPEKRSFIRLNLVSLTFTIGGIAALLVMVGAVVILPLLLQIVWVTDGVRTILGLARWPLLILVLLAGLALLYRYAPSRTEARWQWLSIGALAAALLWIAASFALSWYLSNFGNYDATYGSLGAVIGLMMWLWTSSIVILCGAELNSEIEHQTVRDSTVGPARPLGARGAVTADTIGEAVP